MKARMIVDPAAEDRSLHGHCPRLRQRSHPAVQLAPGRSDLVFLLHSAIRILHAVAADNSSRRWRRRSDPRSNSLRSCDTSIKIYSCLRYVKTGMSKGGGFLTVEEGACASVKYALIYSAGPVG